VTTVRYI